MRGHISDAAFLDLFGDRSRFVQGGAHRLLTKHLFTGSAGIPDGGSMEMVRKTNDEGIDLIRHGLEQVGPGIESAGAAAEIGDFTVTPGAIGVTDGDASNLIRQGEYGFGMGAGNAAGTDEGKT